MRDIRTSRRAVMCALAATPIITAPAVKATPTDAINAPVNSMTKADRAASGCGTRIIETQMPTAKLSKANARDVAMCRRLLTAGDVGAYARGMSGIHRSSSFRQQMEVERAINEDGMAHLFGRHPQSGAMIPAVAA